MLNQMLPWFVVTLLAGIVIGLLVGVFLASTLVKGHYTHFMNHSQPLRRQAPPPPPPQYPDYPHDERRQYPRY